MGILWIIAYLILTVSGLVFIKSGADSVRLEVSKAAFAFSIGWQSLLGFACYLASFVLFTFKILKDYDLSYITPLCMGISQVLIILAAWVFFKEQISLPTMLGIALIIAGVVLLNVKT